MGTANEPVDGDKGGAALFLVQGLLGHLAHGTFNGEDFLEVLRRMEDKPGRSAQTQADIRLARISAESVIGMRP